MLSFNEAGAGCPGIHRVADSLRVGPHHASMRPGQAAPVFDGREAVPGIRDRASMRPGQAAPVFSCAVASARFESVASMRPGQAAPVFQPMSLLFRSQSRLLQ